MSLESVCECECLSVCLCLDYFKEQRCVFVNLQRDGMARFQKEEEEKTLKAITLFCFPEGINWAPLTEYHRYNSYSVSWFITLMFLYLGFSVLYITIQLLL